MRPFLLALATGSACIAVPLTELDGARREREVRTVVLEERFTFYSPYDAGRTAELAAMRPSGCFDIARWMAG